VRFYNACVNLMVNVDQQHILPKQTQNKSDIAHNINIAVRLCKYLTWKNNTLYDFWLCVCSHF